ncbi:unnamed protein product [Schistocephalus solidus]|uniref:Nuclear receptor domain-containing protein n=1 Tax=Schistocephalus solidus TaxID=70667 RepID=A0A183SYD3_SCHSO|nr:unnamed protein product [Schistocephalus solidus]
MFDRVVLLSDEVYHCPMKMRAIYLDRYPHNVKMTETSFIRVEVSEVSDLADWPTKSQAATAPSECGLYGTPNPWDLSQAWWYGQGRLQPRQPPALSPSSGLLDSAQSTACSGFQSSVHPELHIPPAMHHEDPERRVLPQHHHQQQANFQVVNGRFGYPNASMTAAVPYYVGGDGVPWPREAPGDGFPPAAPFTFNHLPPAALSCSSSSSSSSSSSFSAYSSHQTLGSGLVKRKSKRSPVSKLMNLKSSPRTNRVAAPSAAAAAAAAAASVLTTVIRDCASAGSHSSLSAGNPSSIGGDDVSPGDSNEAAKKCKVCGDRAVNHNFGQLTCESCKAFFRRNAHKVSLLLPSRLLVSFAQSFTRRDWFLENSVLLP